MLRYQKQLSAYRKRKEKAAGSILAHLSSSQQTHIKDKGANAKGIWDTLKLVHVQQVPGMRFSVYSKLFGIAKGTCKTLPAIASSIEDTLARVKELCPAIVRLATGTRPYGLDNLNNKLVLMAMLRALLRKEYSNFTSSLMHTKDLTRADVEAVCQVDQTKCNTHRSPLLSSSADTALCVNAANLSHQNRTGVKCGFCTGEGHNKDACFKKDRTRNRHCLSFHTNSSQRRQGHKACYQRKCLPCRLA
jgi:hypothetical protein